MYAAKLGRLIFRDQTGTNTVVIDASSSVVNMHVSMNGHQARCYYGSGLIAEVTVSGGSSVTYTKPNAGQWDAYTKTQMNGDGQEEVALLPTDAGRSAEEEQAETEEGMTSTGGRYDVKRLVYDCQTDPLNWWHLLLTQYVLLSSPQYATLTHFMSLVRESLRRL